MSDGVEVIGADRLAATLRSAADDLRTLNAAAPAGLVAAQARAAAPRRTGRLASSHRVTTTPGAAAVTATAPYAGFVHSGTRYRSARPWLTRASEQTRPRVIDYYQQAAARAIAQVKGT